MKVVWKRLWLASPNLFLIFCTLFLMFLGTGCDRQPSQPDVKVVGEAYVGPMTLGLRTELTSRAPEVLQVKHGEKLELISQRRRFIQVRTPNGDLGWVDGRQLMTGEQIEKIKELAEANKDTVPIGQGTVYDPLNVHNEPNRQSPSFTQIPERGIVDILGYVSTPRVPYEPPQVMPERKKVQPVSRKKKKKEAEKKKQAEEENPAEIPAPPPPPLPENWQVISRSPRPTATPAADQPPVRMDSWSLVRLDNGQTGWALSSMLLMAIPEDVAQYSEGHRIMGYWPLGEIMDGDVKKNHWLWVTNSQRNSEFDFDGFRVFMYTNKRHRYEQAYRLKNLRGYFPTEVVRPGSKSDYLAEFTIITEENGIKIQRRYAFLGYRVMTIDERRWEPTEESMKSAPKMDPELPSSRPPWWKRLFSWS